ncbi:plasmid recombination protein [Chromobacterium violaceum]|uniref:plasmid recombination protein n=1 Tax=Chromobacterium violaceum TaxID=536 RepID=UPI001B31FB43|nr:plasmid recombination protein [Chromobacterium violaceum]MBP4049715.1 plasmid recombination protein [Chromobacterium violaceum]
MYAILRTKKLKTRPKITQAAQHNLRLRKQHNIDSSRSHLNQILYNVLDIDGKEAADFQKKLSEHYAQLGVKEKQGNVLAFEYVVTASPEFFNGKSLEVVGRWAADQVKFMKAEFRGQLKFAVLHLDEKTPHIHFFCSTEIQSVKKYKNQKGEFFKKTWSLNSQKINPEYLADLQTRFANINQKWGLKRGVRGSMQKHVPIKNFYRVVDQIMATDPARRIEKIIEGVEVSIGERLSLSAIKRKIYVAILPLLKGVVRERKIYREFTKMNFHKLQEELIEDCKKLKLEREDILERKEIYREAINSRLNDIEVTDYLVNQNAILAEELEKMRDRYQPEKEFPPALAAQIMKAKAIWHK